MVLSAVVAAGGFAPTSADPVAGAISQGVLGTSIRSGGRIERRTRPRNEPLPTSDNRRNSEARQNAPGRWCAKRRREPSSAAVIRRQDEGRQGQARHEVCRAPESRFQSCGSPLVLVDESAKDVPSVDTHRIGSLGSGLAFGRLKPERPVRPDSVVVLGVRAEDAL